MPQPQPTESAPDPEPPRGLVLVCADPARALGPGETDWLVRRVLDAGVELGVSGEIRATLLGDSEMAAAHLRWSGEPGPTDVLTFNLAEPGEATIDADVLIGAGVAERMASARGIPLGREVLLYVLHALLHCLGYDDHNEEEFVTMHAEEDRLLEAIGVGATFSLRVEGPQ